MNACRVRHAKIPLLLLALGLLFSAGCDNPLAPAAGAGGGSLTLTFVSAASGPASGVSALTLRPEIMPQVATYSVSGQGPNGAAFALHNLDGSQHQVTVSELPAGLWTVEVQAYSDAGAPILSGGTQVVVGSSSASGATVVLEPLYGSATLQFALSWPASEIDEPSIMASLEHVASGNTQPIDFDVEAGSGSAALDGQWDSGYYILEISLLDGDSERWREPYAVWLLAGQTSAASVALDAQDLLPGQGQPVGPGELHWLYAVGSAFSSSIWSSPAVDSAGRVIFGSDDGTLYVLDTDGALERQFHSNGRISSSPAVAVDGSLYFGSHDGYVYALDSEGTQLWSYQTGGWVRSSPAIAADGTVYIGSNDGRLYALDGGSGALNWSFDTGDSVVSSPAIGADGTLFFGSQNGRVYAVNPDGSERWHYQTGDWVYSSPAIGADGTVYVGSYDGFLYALDPAEVPQHQRVIWSYNAGEWIGSSPAIGTAGHVYIGSRDGLLHAVNAETGQEIWTFDAGQGGVYSSPAVGDDGTIYVGSYDRHIYAINPDGSEQWRFETGLGGVYSSPAIGADGTVYVGGRNGTLYAIGSSSTGPLASSWPMFGRDARRRGTLGALFQS